MNIYMHGSPSIVIQYKFIIEMDRKKKQHSFNFVEGNTKVTFTSFIRNQVRCVTKLESEKIAHKAPWLGSKSYMFKFL